MYVEIEDYGRIYQYPTIVIEVVDKIEDEQKFMEEVKAKLTMKSGPKFSKINIYTNYVYKKFFFIKLKRRKTFIQIDYDHSYYKSIDRIFNFVHKKLGCSPLNMYDASYSNFIMNVDTALNLKLMKDLQERSQNT